MDPTIIIAIISFIGTCVGTIGGLITTNKLTNYKIEQLQRKVDAHNNLITRTYELEKNMGIVFQKIEENKSDIQDIKKDVKGIMEKL